VDQADLVKLIEKSLTIRSEQLEVQAARQTREREIQVDIVSESDACNRVLDVINEVAQSDIDTILIEGESGTGKNVLARHIHALSDRHKKQILEISCAALPDTLIESELLGHERGAFTDAKETRKGAFELVDGGTVVLDEIGELKLELQAKLLHVLEERKLRRIGGSREIQVDVRVIGLTNRDLASMVREGTFRQDLFYRLSIFPIRVPPLRERMEDILPLANHFLETLQPKMGRKFKGFSRESENLLFSYSWPGNVRELRNVVERAMILEKSPEIQPAALILNEVSMAGAFPGSEAAPTEAPIVPLEEMERQLVTRAMAATGDNQTRAAELLGVTRDQLRYRLKKFNLGT
ncbi:MAG: sigma-54 dependent transcriptional regulator, partial [Thermoanaerobaculia bacterium]